MYIKKTVENNKHNMGREITYRADKAVVRIILRDDNTASVLEATGTLKAIGVLIDTLVSDFVISEVTNQVHRDHETKAMWKAGFKVIDEAGAVARKLKKLKDVLTCKAQAPSGTITMRKTYNLVEVIND